MATTGRQIVVGFSTDRYCNEELCDRTDSDLYGLVLRDSKYTVVYGSLKTFFDELNNGHASAESMFYYPITID